MTVPAVGLFERAGELAAIDELLEVIGAGSGGVLVVEGPAGIGKSALLGAGRERAVSAGVRVLVARASELERDFAFGVVRQLFEPLIAGDGGELLSGAAAPAGRIVGGVVSERAGQRPPDGSFGALHALYWLASNAGAQAPLLLCVDDAHWADHPSLRFLSFLTKRIGDLPIGLLVSLRLGEPGAVEELLDDVRFDPIARRVDPVPLGASAVSAVVRADFPDASEKICDACHRACGGNPFYLRELLRALAMEGGRLDPDAVAKLVVPSVSERVLRRIARLGGEAVSLARATALLGDGQRLGVVASLAGLDRPVAARAAAALVKVEVLAREDPLSFVHPLVRSSVYGSLSVSERDAGHSSAAGILSGAGAPLDEIAAHLLLTSPAGSQEVTATLRRAAAQATARAAAEIAARYLARALDEISEQTVRVEILRELALAEEHAGRDTAAAHLDAARELATDPVARGRIALQLGRTLMQFFEFERAASTLLRAFGEVPEDEPELRDEIQAELLYMTGFSLDTLPAGIPVLLALPDTPRPGPAGPALLATKAAAMAWSDAPGPEVAALARRALDHLDLASVRYDHMSGALIALLIAEEYELLDGYCSRALEVAERRGHRREIAGLHWQRAQLALALGDLADAEAENEIEEKLIEGIPQALLARSLEYSLRSSVFREQGRLEEADRMIAGVPELAELPVLEWSSDWGAMRMLSARVQLRLLQGRAAEAASDAQRIADELEGREFTFAAAEHFQSTAALALDTVGEHERARALAAREVERAHKIGAPATLGVALRAQALVEKELQPLQESVALLRTSRARLERAKSLVELGAALRRSNQRARARELLAEGLELAHRCGARPTEQRALQELHAAGSRPRRVMRSGVDALTASELRVARMAAAGHSNAQIAQALYISLKTVEMHLGRAYSKLNLSGRQARTELARALQSTP